VVELSTRQWVRRVKIWVFEAGRKWFELRLLHNNAFGNSQKRDIKLTLLGTYKMLALKKTKFSI